MNYNDQSRKNNPKHRDLHKIKTLDTIYKIKCADKEIHKEKEKQKKFRKIQKKILTQ